MVIWGKQLATDINFEHFWSDNFDKIIYKKIELNIIKVLITHKFSK